MTAETAGSYWDDPTFSQLLADLQQGKWHSGLAKLDGLLGTYPNDPDLRQMRQETLLKVLVDQDEVIDRKQERFQRTKKFGFRFALVAVVLIVLTWGLSAYSQTLNQRWEAARQDLEAEFGQVELAMKFRNAQDLLQAGRLAEAELLFQEVGAEDPNYPGLELFLNQTYKLQALDELYTQAMQHKATGDLGQAISKFQEIKTRQPYYKDVALQIELLENSFLLEDLLAQADGAYEAGDFATAAAKYKTIHSMDPEFQRVFIENRLVNSYMSAAESMLMQDQDTLEALQGAEEYFRLALGLRPDDETVLERRARARATVEERLFRSYLHQGRQAVVNNEDSLAALAIAEGYFRQALELRPEDEEAQLELQLAQFYLTAQSDFSKGLWNKVISDLEYVYSNRPEYAAGTARQTLYEAYTARGNSFMAGGDYESALADYQRASVLASQFGKESLGLFEAQTKVAEVQGVLGDYESAVRVYRDALNLDFIVAAYEEGESPLNKTIEDAERYAGWANYRRAYGLYRSAAERLLFMTPRIVYTLQQGDYITQLANRYGTTVAAILAENNLASIEDLQPNQQLVLPVAVTKAAEDQGENP